MTIEGEGERWLSIIAGSHLDLLENLSHLVPNRLKKTFTDYHLWNPKRPVLRCSAYNTSVNLLFSLLFKGVLKN